MDGLAALLGFDVLFEVVFVYINVAFKYAFFELLGIVGVLQTWRTEIAFADFDLEVFS